jgi:hypothetical protein
MPVAPILSPDGNQGAAQVAGAAADIEHVPAVLDAREAQEGGSQPGTPAAMKASYAAGLA